MSRRAPEIILLVPHDLSGGLGCKCGVTEGHRAHKRFSGCKKLVLNVRDFYCTRASSDDPTGLIVARADAYAPLINPGIKIVCRVSTHAHAVYNSESYPDT